MKNTNLKSLSLMRGKVEREGVGKPSSQTMGGVRLTEFNRERFSGFVRRLNNEAITYFFTNFPEETMVVDLWRVFAKYGRVGEVYVPNKVDKWGWRFGFAKFLEVQNVEELSSKLEEVWCGSFKLKVNLSRFGRNSNLKNSDHHGAGNNSKPPEQKDVIAKEYAVRSGDGRTFKQALGEGPKNQPNKSRGKGVMKEGLNELGKEEARVPVPLSFEPDKDFLQVLGCSFVGKLVQGKNIKMLQLNLCLEGYRNVRAASMGEGRVLLFSFSGEDVNTVLSKKSWWEGILEDIRP
jgi:RNA recognition motif-containing protein